MKRTTINHFLGKNTCETIDDVQRTLDQSVDGVNEFFIRQEHTMYPHLIVLINGLYAYVTCVPTEEAAGTQAFSDESETDLDPDGISIFYTNTPSEEIEIYNDYVISKDLAVQVVKEFVETGRLSSCVEWEEL
ncbi:hypothetical protein D1641_04860 [Colidextribacter sp. OB.20]|uniref:Imm1 family immunity protein n=1 Tax=Colidextribacter sp. OB.20 TaxID=2304568 RepID=UPI0013695EF4|nr:Imm1 family immunity protein [Colidextribacter sp. OB.20]NBI09351.1 hypothetical protein [Colidextribacter sp. OB.20]